MSSVSGYSLSTSSLPKETHGAIKTPIWSLSRDQITQFVTTRITQVDFYSSGNIEMTTEKDEKKFANLRFSSPKEHSSFGSYLKKAYWIITQLGSDEYKLTSRVRGPGGGAGSSAQKDIYTIEFDPKLDAPLRSHVTDLRSDTYLAIIRTYGKIEALRIAMEAHTEPAYSSYAQTASKVIEVLLERHIKPKELERFNIVPDPTVVDPTLDRPLYDLIPGSKYMYLLYLKLFGPALTLYLAVDKNAVQVVEVLISRHLKANVTQVLSCLADRAVAADADSVLVALLKKGMINPNSNVDEYLYSNGQRQQKKKDASVNVIPLVEFALKRSPLCAKLLVGAGAKLRRECFDAAFFSTNPYEALKILLDAKMSPNSTVKNIPAVEYALKNSPQCAKLLVDAGATLRPECFDIVFSSTNPYEALIFVLDRGINPNSVNVDFVTGEARTPLMRVIHDTKLFNMSSVDRMRVVKLLVERGADVNAQIADASNQVFQDALSMAAVKNNEVMVRYLLDLGAKPTATWFKTAFQTLDPKIAILLAEAGIDGNMFLEGYLRDRYYSNKWDENTLTVLSLLLRNGADPLRIPPDFYATLPKNIQEMLGSSASSNPALLQTAEYIVKKILGSISNLIYEKLDGANKIDELKITIKDALMDSNFVIFCCDDQSENVLTIRREICSLLSNELNNILGKKDYFNTDQSFLNTKEIKEWLIEALNTWKIANKSKLLEQQRHQQEIESQEDLLRTQESLLREQMANQEMLKSKLEKITQEAKAQAEADRQQKERLANEHERLTKQLAKERKEHLEEVERSIQHAKYVTRLNIARNT